MEREHDALVFGRRVRMLREAKGMTVRGLAKRAGISSSAVSQIENGERPYPRFETKEKIANALGVTVAELEGRTALSVEEGILRFHDPEFDRYWRQATPEVRRDVQQYLIFKVEQQQKRKRRQEGND